MLRKVAVIIVVVGVSIAASWLFYAGLEAGDGTAINTLLKRIFVIAAVGGIIAAAVASITRFDDES